MSSSLYDWFERAIDDLKLKSGFDRMNYARLVAGTIASMAKVLYEEEDEFEPGFFRLTLTVAVGLDPPEKVEQFLDHPYAIHLLMHLVTGRLPAKRGKRIQRRVGYLADSVYPPGSDHHLGLVEWLQEIRTRFERRALPVVGEGMSALMANMMMMREAGATAAESRQAGRRILGLSAHVDDISTESRPLLATALGYVNEIAQYSPVTEEFVGEHALSLLTMFVDFVYGVDLDDQEA